MKKKAALFICQACGNEHPRWMGKCSFCQEWNTLLEEEAVQKKESHRAWVSPSGQRSTPLSLTEVGEEADTRISSLIGELDRVLGGGLVLGSLGLVGGDPGIGKSTLLMMVAANIAKKRKVLYVSGEESVNQLRLRAIRLHSLHENIKVVCEADVDRILQFVREDTYHLVIVDSIQTVYVPTLPSSPGSVTQVKESAARFLLLAKSTGVPVLLVGHVTKEGSIAGPKVLEHAVDFVLYFEGDKRTTFRILRGVKNRFGSTNEVGIFDMRAEGLIEVTNPSSLFLAERSQGSSGSVVVPFLEGTRPLLVEIQALVGATPFGGHPRRQSTGLDYNRFSIILAVLEKRQRYALHNQDVFVNAAGGLRIDEPAADLGIAVAVASSFQNAPIDPALAVIGEIGLAGELRAVPHLEIRLNELAKLGFTKVVVPKQNYTSNHRIECLQATTVLDALQFVLGGLGKGR